MIVVIAITLLPVIVDNKNIYYIPFVIAITVLYSGLVFSFAVKMNAHAKHENIIDVAIKVLDDIEKEITEGKVLIITSQEEEEEEEEANADVSEKRFNPINRIMEVIILKKGLRRFNSLLIARFEISKKIVFHKGKITEQGLFENFM